MKTTKINQNKKGTRERVDGLPRNLLMYMASNCGPRQM